MIKGNPKMNEEGIKFIGLAGLVIINGVFVFPFMRTIYNSIFTNNAEITHLCYMEVSVNGKPFGSIDFGLFGKVAPKNINNFLHLINRKELGYKGSTFHKIVPKYILYGGDILNNNGTGHLSAFDNIYIEDEISKDVSFCEPGLLAMSNRGKDTNGSQFFVTLDDLPFINNKYTIIGKIVKGYDVAKNISVACGDMEGLAKCVVKIDKAGVYKYEEYKSKNKNFKL